MQSIKIVRISFSSTAVKVLLKFQELNARKIMESLQHTVINYHKTISELFSKKLEHLSSIITQGVIIFFVQGGGGEANWQSEPINKLILSRTILNQAMK